MSTNGEATDYVKKLIKKRDGTARRLRRIALHLRETLTAGTGDMSIDAAKIDRDDLEKCFSEFEAVQAEIEEEASGDELDLQEEERIKIETVVREVRVSASNFLRKNTASIPSGVSSPIVTAPTNKIKRPEITVPKFSGEFKKWAEFKNVFTSLVINETVYNDVERMIYLKQAVENKAAEVIANFEISRENFAKAWEKLRRRYENKRAVISTYLEALCKLPVAKAETDVAPLLDAATDAIESLNSVGVENGWQMMLCHLVATKLDQETRKQWELSLVQDDEYPTYEKLEKFLQQRVRVFESIGGASVSAKPNVISSRKDKADKPVTEKSKVLLAKEALAGSSKQNASGNSNFRVCFDCGAATHSLAECKSFGSKTIEERTQLIQKRGLCFNCLNRGHRVAACRSKRCEKCDRRHHVLLHRESYTASSSKEILEPPLQSKPEMSSEKLFSEENKTATRSLFVQPSSTFVCLPAALVYVFGNSGHRFLVRAFLDSGSGINVISEKLVKKLRCRCEPSNVVVSTLMPGQMTVSHSCVVNIKSRFNSYSLDVKFQVAPSIAEDFISFDKTCVDSKLIENRNLADNPKINEGCVDILIGAEFFEELMLSGKVKLGDKAYLRETEFGWIFIGLAEKTKIFANPSVCYLTLEANCQRFWEIDEIFEKKDSWTEEEKRVDIEFEKTYTRNEDGRFVLALPKNLSADMLGESRNLAFRRLLAQEKRLNKIQLNQRYDEFLKEYESLGHMTPISCSEAVVYLPHHAVLREESSTTKLRVVFNAAALTSSGYSLNDFLAKGPVLQEDLFLILMRFRSYKVAFTADIEKMYRQILIKSEDRKYQCILWRNPTTKIIETYRLNTVTYGTKPASYLATKCLSKLAELNSVSYPESSSKLRSDFYMDDLLSGASTVDTAKIRIKEISEILGAAGFPLRKFAASCKEALEDLDRNLVVHSRTFQDMEAVSILGMKWTSEQTDQFVFFNRLSIEMNVSTMTKRLFLSKIFRIYDPLGLLAPVVASFKFLLQDLWRCKMDWDDEVPLDLLTKFRKMCQELEVLSTMAVNRWSGYSENSELHVFCDASQRGYGAAVYVRTVMDDGEIDLNLLCAKSRVAPLKILTIPRLELCSALLGARLFGKVKVALRLPATAPVFLWSDSTIVLAWLYFENGNCATFVANRVSKIREITPSDKWYHVRSEDNAADVVSRGLESNFLSLYDFWRGPSFLREKKEIEIPEIELDPLAMEEMVQKSRSCLVVDQGIFFFQRFSTYEGLIAFTAYIMRFQKTLREERYDSLELGRNERLRAHQILIRKVQSSVVEKIAALDSFVDKDGIWRLRSRLGKSDWSFEAKYPIIIPKGRFLLLLIRYLHRKYFHAGLSFLRNFIRTMYHVMADLNRLIRGIVYNCVTCRRFAKNLTYDPPIGELPSYRVTVSQAFNQVGVDFAGPFQTRAVGPSRNRSKVIFKSYVCIFVCMVSRAVHIEVVEDLSTKAFLDCFNRFISRRGMCNTVYSDHGTNFVGANHELRVAFEFLKRNRSELVSYCSKMGVDWKFIPERAPHFGGLWEAAVKSFKYHFKRVVGLQILSFTELATLSCRIEAVLNARPICATSDSASTVLTPAHLCLGKAINILPPITGEVVKGAAKVRYNMVQAMFENFWNVWRNEYLVSLRGCYFKKLGSRQAKLDDIVLMKEDNVPPANWPMGRIVKCYLGTDKVCRVVDVLVNGKVLRRPVIKLIPLLPEVHVD